MNARQPAADSSDENPFQSPGDLEAPVAAEGCVEAIIRLAGIAFAGLLFAFFAFNAIDSLRPHSIIQENPLRHPPRPTAWRIENCIRWSIFASLALATIIFLTWPWDVSLVRAIRGRKQAANDNNL